jgi:lipopolysaccharide transport system permease protein
MAPFRLGTNDIRLDRRLGLPVGAHLSTAPAKPPVGGISPGALMVVFADAWRRRHLVLRLVQHELEARYRGSILGKSWAVLTPLFMLGMYTFVFVVVFPARWEGHAKGTAGVALLYFTGLILFDFMLECLVRAPLLMAEYVAFIRKVIFPLEALAWVALGVALARLTVSFLMLFAFYLVIYGMPPASALVLPLLLTPLALVAVGSVWILSLVGVFVRDIRHIIGMAAPVVMFLTPIFYPLSAVPEPFRSLLYANPLTFVTESMRAALFSGVWPAWRAFALYALAAWLFAVVAHRCFMQGRMALADVA